MILFGQATSLGQKEIQVSGMNSHSSPPNYSGVPLLAQLAIENRILSKEQVHDALAQIAGERRKGTAISLEDYLLNKGLIDKGTLSRLIAATVRYMDKKFSALAIQNKIVDQTYVNKALDIQKQAFAQGSLKLVSDILMEWNVLTVSQRDDLLEKLTLPNHGKTLSPQQPQTAPDVPKPDVAEESDRAISLEIRDHELKAILHIPGNLNPKPDINQVKALLKDHGIIYGILEDSDIETLLAKVGDKPYSFTIAQGRPGAPPIDAELKLHFSNDYLNPGKITESGSIDFRERGDVPFVTSGTLLAEKTKGVDGKPGTTLFGQSIPADKANDLSLKSSSGTEASGDGLKIYATMDGQPFITIHGEVSVFKELHIPGDVDYTTGNISFDGNIIVKGSIKEGFTVKGGNLIAKDMNGAIIDVKGNIDVSGGIIDSVITLGGSIQAMYMTGSKVDAYGDILIKKEIIDSKIRTSGACIGDQVNLIASFVSAKKGIQAKRVGTDVSKPCTLRVGISDHTNKIIKNLKLRLDDQKTLLDKTQSKAEELKDIQKKLHQQIMEMSITQDRLSKQKAAITNKVQEMADHTAANPEEARLISRLQDALTQCCSEIKRVDDLVAGLFKQQDGITNDILLYQSKCEPIIREIEELNHQIQEVRSWDKKSAPKPLIQVTKEIHANTSISGPNVSKVIKDIHKNVSIREIRHTDPDHTSWDFSIESN